VQPPGTLQVEITSIKRHMGVGVDNGNALKNMGMLPYVGTPNSED